MNNAAIVSAAYDVVRGDGWVPKDARGNPVSGYCLALVRNIVEKAYGMEPYALYEHYVTEWVQPSGYVRSGGHWARDAERSLRNLGMAVSYGAREPGDLVFNWEAAYSDRWKAYVGHVGVLLHGDLVLENIHPSYRTGIGFMRDSTGLTPIHGWPRVTTMIRFHARDIVEPKE